jgi:hypothetical protein
MGGTGVKTLIRHLVVGSTMATTLLVSGAASAEIIVNERFPFTQMRVNSCNGEELVASGVLHRVEKLLPNGTLQIIISVHATAVGSEGNEYVVNGQHHITSSSSEFLEVFRDRLISKGSAPDQHVLLTVSSPPFEFQFEADCRG